MQAQSRRTAPTLPAISGSKSAMRIAADWRPRLGHASPMPWRAVVARIARALCALSLILAKCHCHPRVPRGSKGMAPLPSEEGELEARIAADPRYIALVRDRSRFAWVLTAIT